MTAIAPTSKLRRTLMYGAGIAGIAGGIFFGSKTAEKEESNNAASKPSDDVAAIKTLFSLSFENTAGQSIPLAKFREKPLVINFWATWCPPCVEEMPELSEWNRKVQDKIAIVGIGIDSPSNIREFAVKNKISYELLIAGMGGTELSRLLGNTTGALPFTVVISQNHKITLKTLGKFSLPQIEAATKAS
jgi:thiol-disulfide isomerase/thioredoxin